MKFARFWLFLLLGSLAHAHPLDLALVTLSVDENRVAATMDLHPTIVANLLKVDESQLTALTLQARAEALHQESLGAGILRSGEKTCEWEKPIPIPVTGTQKITVKATAVCAAGLTGKLDWDFGLLRAAGLPPGYQLMVRVQGREGENLLVAEPMKTRLQIDLAPGVGFFSFVWSGMEHIGATPDQWYSDGKFHLPDGIDHILFLLALILAGGGVWSLVKTATGFTVGHSLTLALAVTGVVQLPGRLVESLIALSIAFVAAQALLQKGRKDTWKVATFFGLVHGFGFANALGNLGLSGLPLIKALVAFNLGVEIGQVAIIAVLAPLCLRARDKQWLGGYAVRACAGLVMVAGGFWFVQRAFAL